MIDSRECRVCHQVKSLEEFAKCKTSVGGRRPQCKKCHTQEWKERHYPRLKQSEFYLAQQRKAQAKYARKNKIKVNVHRSAQKVPLADSCENCGAEAKHRHHTDYNKPLEIISLCVACHEAIHHEGATV